MKTPPFPAATLTGETIVLEPLAERHWPGILAVGLAPELWTWTIEGVEGEADLRRWFDGALAAGRDGRAVPFATVVLVSGRVVVGSTRFGNLDAGNRRVEIGWTWVAPAWQRTGVNAEAKYLMLRQAFEAWGCHRVELKTDALNAQSRGAMLRLGAREEGVFRKYQVRQDGRVRDTAWYSVTADEWPGVKSGLERRLWEPPPAR
jgi:RimJ/RimL family protein N-acetyltransferase